MKKIRLLFLSICLLFSFTLGVFASDGIKKVTAYIRPDYQVFLNGEKVNVGPILLYNDRSYLPLRQIGELIDAQVHWRSENKGIYINQRYPGQPKPVEDKDYTYDKIELFSPQLYKVTYLGGDHFVLSNISPTDYKKYYREYDLNLMGIDTRGLRKAYEPFTDDYYVSEDELALVWSKQPVFIPYYDYVIIGDDHSERVKLIKDFIESIPQIEAWIRQDDPYYYPGIPIVYLVETLPDHQYRIFCYQDGSFALYTVTLKQSDKGVWYQSSYNKRVHTSNHSYYPYY